MEFRTIVNIPSVAWQIQPCEKMLFVGSCFADKLGMRFQQEQFRANVNPYGVMYNPASILHTVERWLAEGGEVPNVAVFTLGTNHVYILKETGEIVDNCQKRPQRLFDEQQLSVEECEEYLERAIRLLRNANTDVKVILTVSPIRYRKYGYHGSQLSKATLHLAVGRLADKGAADYFPAYEILVDELRDYRFYADDMLHPSAQAVEYIYERFAHTYFSEATEAFLKEWHPIAAALAHKPFNPDGEEYKEFMRKTMQKVDCLSKKYPNFAFKNKKQ